MAKNQFILLLCVLISEPIFGGDFRALDFGDVCENISEQESKLNGKQLGTASGPFYGFIGPFEFHGQLIASEATIIYQCNIENVFTKGSVLLNQETPELAEKKSDELYLLLESIHGPPNEVFRDNEDPDIGVIINWKLSAYKISLHTFSEGVSLEFTPSN